MQHLILRNFQSPGDVVMLTAAVRDLHACYPNQFHTDIRTSCPQLWENNPYITLLDDQVEGIKTIDCHYPLIHRSNAAPSHFLNGFVDYLNEQLGLRIQVTAFQGDIHLSEAEKVLISPVAELTGREQPFWIMAAGGKRDYTIKWWDTQRYQAVVDHFRGKIQFVQVGSSGHFHPELEGVIDMRGKTDLRQLIRLLYHAQGVVTPVSLLMHLAAAVPYRKIQRDGGNLEIQTVSGLHRSCVVVAGGREPKHWESYPTHQFIHTIGLLPCCRTGGCWKSRTVPLGDRTEHDRPEHLCVDVLGKLPRCMDLITAAEVIRRIELFLAAAQILPPSPSGQSPIELTSPAPPELQGMERLTLETAKYKMEEYLKQLTPYPGNFQGRGIVICGGGIKYFTCAWICIHMLRRLGCTLPIQLWFLGAKEIDERMKELVAPYGVECIDGLMVRQLYPARRLNGWELKPYAILHSPFKEVLYLDADNVPVVNPEFLFMIPQFAEAGALFWPDYGRLKSSRLIWHICGIPYRDEPEFESGQIVVDKEKCWQALALTMWFNEHSDFYYQHIHGDKETFHMAFRKLEQPYSMPATPVHALHATMCQHDFDGRRIFQHRNGDKWTFSGQNKTIADFWYEKECKDYLKELDRLWYGPRLQVPRFSMEKKNGELNRIAKQLIRTDFDYHRIGFDRRVLHLLPDGRVGEGGGKCESFWDVLEENSEPVLVISSEHEATCRLKLEKDGIWQGRWLHHETMPVELTPVAKLRKGQGRAKPVLKLKKPLRSTEPILLRAPLTGYTGYGLHATQIVTDLQKLGYEFEIRAIIVEETFAPIPANVRHSIVSEEPRRATWELLLHPPGHSVSADRKTVYFTMWESTRLRPSAVHVLNQAEHIIVPTQWNASCFSACGVERPIHIVPLGINTECFNYRPMIMDGPCIFGTAGRFESGGTRKGINQVIELFQKAFPKEKDVRLAVKVFPDCKVPPVSDPRVQITRSYLTEPELADWFAGITCFVSAAKGEGWGLMQHQALAIGRPLISVKFGGVAEFFSEEIGYSLNYKLALGEGFYSGCGLLAEPDENHLAELMRGVYMNRLEARQRGEKGAALVAHYSWTKSNARLVHVLREIGMLP